MKAIILYLVSTIVSGIWLWNFHQTYNPIILKGPDFLKFYLMLLTGFYASLLAAKLLKINHSKIAFYLLSFFLLLGLIKLVRGIYLGKPVGYLTMMVVLQVIVMIIFKSNKFNKNFK